ncbi:MAG: DUF4920 domain-containing protein [Sandaracinaceae bacterium]|nr:DUF4920 domain-containing protein [Sandaracinaceae bacterium]
MNRTSISLWVALALGACGGSDETAANDEATTPPAETSGDEAANDAPEPARVLADGSRLFGAELSERDDTPLSTILGDPSTFDGQVVKTSGEISAVCQAMGCWMELRADAESPGIRVPMANHAFFLPRDLAGARATIEGTVTVAALDDATREHLESEGAQAAGSELSIEATGVIVHP